MDDLEFSEYRNGDYVFMKFEPQEYDRHVVDISGLRMISGSFAVSYLVTLYAKHLDEYTMHQFNDLYKLYDFLVETLQLE
jgi:hypothetical protein